MLFRSGQSADAQPSVTPVTDSEIVSLNAFTVTATPANGYRAEKTVSGTLIATDVKRMPASIQVVTEAFIADMDTRRVEDSIRYVSGVGLSARNEGAGGGTRRGRRAESIRERSFLASCVRKEFACTLKDPAVAMNSLGGYIAIPIMMVTYTITKIQKIGRAHV